MTDFRAGSYDAPRRRGAPTVLSGHSLDGEAVRVRFEAVTIVAAVKARCESCREFVVGGLEALGDVAVVVVCAVAPDDDEWRGAVRDVLVSAQALAELEIWSAPFYVLVDPATSTVLTEGSLFSPAQVAREIAGVLRP